MPNIYRVASPERLDWRLQADAIGYTYYRNSDGSDAWREDVAYCLDPTALSRIKHTTERLHRLCLWVVNHACTTPGGLDPFHIPAAMHAVVRQSWARRDTFLIGRFDFAWCGGHLKLIEYNADTPATVPESTAMQTLWQRDCMPNHAHAPLDDAAIVGCLSNLRARCCSNVLHIVPYPDNLEDRTHAVFYARWAEKAGFKAVHCELRDLEVSCTGRFLHRGTRVETMLRLYPWELMFRDSGARHLAGSQCLFLNPPWTALLSNKALLVRLWDLFPDDPNILPATFDADVLATGAYVTKPIHARGGENVAIIKDGRVIVSQTGTYGRYPRIYQSFADHRIDGVAASIGAWIVGDAFAGITMRESHDPIIRHTSPIVPHIIEPRVRRIARALGF